MACYARAGRYTEALRQYQLLRTVLRRELDLAPDPATEALYRDLMKKRRAGASGPLYALPGAEPEDDVAPRARRRARLRPPPADDRVLQTGVVLAMRLPGLAAQRRTLDPEETRELTQRLQRLFDETVSLHGGVADRLSGDRLVAVFGLENLTGNEPQRALRAAQAIIHAFGASDLTPGAPAAGIAQGALLPTRIDGPFPLSGDPMSDAESLAGPGESGRSAALRRPAPRARRAQPAVRGPPGRAVADELAARALRRDAPRAHHRHARRRRHRQDAPARGAHGRRARARHRLPSRAGARLRPGQGAPPAGGAVREPARRRGRRRARRARARGRRGDRVRPPAGRQHPARERPRRRAAVRGPGVDRAQRRSAGARARPHGRSCGG